jgi:hypothetical protein
MLHPVPWAVDQVLALAPDSSAAKAGRDLSSVHKWKSLGQNDAAVWGECKGSAAEPYKTVIDLSEPAFKCSCPSRKFPCKHSLGLFLIYVSQAGAIPNMAVPPWAQEWLARRVEKSRPREDARPKTAEDIARLAEQQEKRTRRRAARVEDGIEELRLWLADLVREGLRELPSRPRQFWDQPAARMVDAQAPGLARHLQEMATIPYSGSGWPERLLTRVGRLHLLLEGHRRLDALPDELKHEVRSQLGFTQTSDDVLAWGERVSDTWSVLGRRVVTDERLTALRTWLWGERAQQYALVLDFAPGRGSTHQHPLDLTLVPGTSFSGTLAYFTGSLRQRALVVERESPRSVDHVPGDESIDEALTRTASFLARNPWLDRVPMSLKRVRPFHRAEDWFVVDGAGTALPILPTSGWKLLAMSGGDPIDLFAEWDWEHLDVLCAIGQDGFVMLGVTSG